MRAPGYYWVKLGGEWIPAELSVTGSWWIVGSDLHYYDVEFEEIGEPCTRPQSK